MLIRMTRSASLLGALLLTGACAEKRAAETGDTTASAMAAAQAAPAISVEITEPVEGATVASPVKVVLKTAGIEIVAATDERPGTGHHHLFVDHPLTPPNDTIPRGVTGILHLGRGQTEMVLDSLKPGPHRVIDVVGDFKHRPLTPTVADTVHFTVR